jgi:hypothetical protein
LLLKESNRSRSGIRVKCFFHNIISGLIYKELFNTDLSAE